MRVIAVVLIILSLVIGIVPQYTDCQSQGMAIELPNGKTIPMKCHWTATAELAVAVPLLATGVMLLIARRRETSLMLAAMGLILGVFTVLLPNVLIGVCSSAMMCNLVMQPLLTLCGVLVIAASVAALVLTLRRKETAS